MSISARFEADFSSFQTAVKGAEVSLRSFETGAGKVEKALNKMSDGFSGRKTIQDANLVVEAVDRIGGASKLTEAEQRRVSTSVSDAIAKYRALGMEAPPTMLALARATTQVQQQTSMADKAVGFLKSSFAQFTAAGLATSAIQSLTGELQRFIGQGMQLRGIETSFQRLSSSAKQNSGEMLTALQAGTRGMVSNVDLMTQANKAMLLGLPVTTESMGELSQAATTLGRAMGQDATKSLDDLITALGRSSPMILDNLGLTVKVGEANEAYAAKLGKTSEQLTDAEKKMAFYEAAMEAARAKTEQLGEQTKTLGEIATTVWTQVGNAVTAAASAINVGLGSALSSKGGFFQFLQDAITNGPGAAVVMADLRTQLEAVGKTIKQDVNLPLPAFTTQLSVTVKGTKDAAKSTSEFNREAEKEALALRKVIISVFEANEKLADYVAKHRTLQPLLQDTIPVFITWSQTVEHTQIRLKELAAVLVGEFSTAQAKAKSIIDQAREALDRQAESAQKIRDFSGQLSQTIIGAVQGGGNVGESVGSFLGAEGGKAIGKKLATEIGGKFGEVLGGLAGPLGAIGGQMLGKLIDKIFSKAGRNTVVDFAESMGGFDSLREKLNALGEDGERLWINLTQKVGKGNVEQAKSAIKAIEDALEAHRIKAEKVAESIGAAQREATAEQEKAADKVRGTIADLDSQYESLYSTIKNEAPEDEMGIIERNTRAEMERIRKERATAETELERITSAMEKSFDRAAEAAEKAAKAIADAFGKLGVPGIAATEGRPPLDVPDGKSLAVGHTTVVALDGEVLVRVVERSLSKRYRFAQPVGAV